MHRGLGIFAISLHKGMYDQEEAYNMQDAERFREENRDAFL